MPMIPGGALGGGPRLATEGRTRICLPTARRFSRMAFQCGHLEAQDVIEACDDVDLIHLDAVPGVSERVRWMRRLMYRDVSRRLAYVNPGVRRVKLTKNYDVLVVMCQGYWEFLYVNAIDGWKDHCKTSICWIDELYAADLPSFKYWLPSLNRFDHVAVGLHGTVAALSDVLGRPCHYVPGAVDALRFSPYPDVPRRVIDVFSVGRKAAGVHRALLKTVAEDGIFYVHDTVQSGVSPAEDHREHRELYANLAKRSRFFLVAPGKSNAPEHVHAQREIGFRYYEGAAAGTVMLGEEPKGPMFHDMFDWPDAVVPARQDGSDITAVMSELSRDPERLETISRRNARGALLRHDWIHRWKRLLEIAGLPTSPGMTAREETMAKIAAGLNVP